MDRVEKEEFIVASGYNMLSPGFMREKGYTKFFATKKNSWLHILLDWWYK